MGRETGAGTYWDAACETGPLHATPGFATTANHRAFCAKQDGESAESFARSRQGSNACVGRVASDGHPRLARSTHCVAQWLHGGAARICMIRTSYRCALRPLPLHRPKSYLEFHRLLHILHLAGPFGLHALAQHR